MLGGDVGDPSRRRQRLERAEAATRSRRSRPKGDGRDPRQRPPGRRSRRSSWVKRPHESPPRRGADRPRWRTRASRSNVLLCTGAFPRLAAPPRPFPGAARQLLLGLLRATNVFPGRLGVLTSVRAGTSRRPTARRAGRALGASTPTVVSAPSPLRGDRSRRGSARARPDALRRPGPRRASWSWTAWDFGRKTARGGSRPLTRPCPPLLANLLVGPAWPRS